VRVLAWAGAPLPLFHLDRREVRAVRDELSEGTRVQVALDARERPMHCHHEKLVIADGETAFVGGIDLTSFAGDRLDTARHPTRGSLGRHDAAARIRGPCGRRAASTCVGSQRRAARPHQRLSRRRLRYAQPGAGGRNPPAPGGAASRRTCSPPRGTSVHPRAGSAAEGRCNARRSSRGGSFAQAPSPLPVPRRGNAKPATGRAADAPL